MGRRFVYRILMIVPVTLSVLFVTLFLFYKLPGTQVFDSEQIVLGSDRELEQLLRGQVNQDPFFTTPGLFYFSLKAGYIPDSMYLVPMAFHASFKSLAEDVSRPMIMNKYALWIGREIDAVKSKDSVNVTARQLLHILSASSKHELEDQIDLLEIAPDNRPPVWKEVLSSDRLRSIPPVSFQWNGFQNTFHYYIRGLITGQPTLKTISGERVEHRFHRTVRWTLAYTMPVLLVGWGVVFLFVLYFYDHSALLARLDRILVFVYSFPTFVLAMLALIFLTSHRYGAISRMFPFPVFLETGVRDLGAIYRNYSFELLLPMLLFAISPMILFYRVFYEKIEEIKMSQPSYRYLRHTGVSASDFRFKYLSKYLFVATWALLSNLFVAILGGSMIIELIFNIPGLGRFLYDSIVNYDVQSTVYLIFLFTVVQQIGHIVSDVMIEYFFASGDVKSDML
ncbi:ABC transporter permease subunit [Membranicola marinus]|uniref:ABC transporter permease subunit n=1 Tax=Membranihabitans marinus TaxID=1227546 RepID=A0A953HLR5_9BACT|nr:ABC transporter permease subunit [Membranihabitans marinus]MBY5958284.1 ABC transporter permease subunit [Membranihabitans marinus]